MTTPDFIIAKTLVVSTERRKEWDLFRVDTLKSVEVLTYIHINGLAAVTTHVALDALESLVGCHVVDHTTRSCLVLRHVGRGVDYAFVGSLLSSSVSSTCRGGSIPGSIPMRNLLVVNMPDGSKILVHCHVCWLTTVTSKLALDTNQGLVAKGS
jgi:hypothetical protein